MLLVVIGVLVALQVAGLDVRTVLGGAAILGVAIAFGAQNLMRDYFKLNEDGDEINLET